MRFRIPSRELSGIQIIIELLNGYTVDNFCDLKRQTVNTRTILTRIPKFVMPRIQKLEKKLNVMP